MRLPLALVLSLLVHLLLVAGWSGGGGRDDAGVSPVLLPARLDPAAATAAAAVSELVPPPAAESFPSPRVAEPVPRPAPATAAPVQPTAAEGPDLRFYLARELDQYPAPLQDLERMVAPASRIRLWVSIDQAGQVVAVEVVDAGAAAAPGPVLRDRLFATRFSPGWRDGRPVKSRVLLEFGRGT